MDEILSKIFAILLSIILMIFFPLLDAFQRQDDISNMVIYKSVTGFVDASRDKGFISPTMYRDFLTQINSTGNSYDVQIRHQKKSYNPVYNIYYVEQIQKQNNEPDRTSDFYYEELEKRLVKTVAIDEVVGVTNGLELIKPDIKIDISNTKLNSTDIVNTTRTYTQDSITYNVITAYKYEMTYNINYITSSNQAIIDQTLFPSSGQSQNYKLAIGDYVSVTVKNKNKTQATLLMNFFTLGNSDPVKIFANYGGMVRNEDY